MKTHIVNGYQMRMSKSPNAYLQPKISNYRVLPTENRSREPKYSKLTIAEVAGMSGHETASGLKTSSYEANYKDLRIRTLERQLDRYTDIQVKKQLATINHM